MNSSLAQAAWGESWRATRLARRRSNSRWSFRFSSASCSPLCRRGRSSWSRRSSNRPRSSPNPGLRRAPGLPARPLGPEQRQAARSAARFDQQRSPVTSAVASHQHGYCSLEGRAAGWRPEITGWTGVGGVGNARRAHDSPGGEAGVARGPLQVRHKVLATVKCHAYDAHPQVRAGPSGEGRSRLDRVGGRRSGPHTHSERFTQLNEEAVLSLTWNRSN